MNTTLMNELKLKKSCINDNEECSICYDKYKNIQSIYLLEECNHMFCKPCIFKQMNYDKHKQNIVCPLCRMENINIKFPMMQNYDEQIEELHNQNIPGLNFSERDIQYVMDQLSGCTIFDAFHALNNNHGNINDALYELAMV